MVSTASTFVLLAALALHPSPASSEDTWPSPSRVVAVGDVHGDLDAFVTVLKAAGLVDDKLKWTGGRAHLVQTGDRVDRGPDSRKVMDLLMRLEKDARKASGMVHALTGNHEVMNVLGDLRYVIPEEFSAFKSPDSLRLRDALWEQQVQRRKDRKEAALTADDRRQFDTDHPLGWVEHRLAWGARGTYGSWIAKANAIARVGEAIFLHGGIGPKYADFSRSDLNERIRRELEEPDPLTALVSQDPEGPLWYRGLAREDPALLPHLEMVLQRHGVRRMVIGHTPTEGLVLPLYGGRVVMIDVGLAKAYGGPPAALVLEDGRAMALHRGKTIPLPEGDGTPLVDYVKSVAALEPDAKRLRPVLERVEAGLSAAPPR
jgi:hypothetical protein